MPNYKKKNHKNRLNNVCCVCVLLIITVQMYKCVGTATHLIDMINCVACYSVQYDDIRLMRYLPKCLANWEIRSLIVWV